MDKIELIAAMLYKMRGHYPYEHDIMAVYNLYEKFSKHDESVCNHRWVGATQIHSKCTKCGVMVRDDD